MIELSGGVEKGLMAVQPIAQNFEKMVRDENQGIDGAKIDEIVNMFLGLLVRETKGEHGAINLSGLAFQRNLDNEEIDQLLSFYESDLWAKYRFDKQNMTKSENDELMREYTKVFKNEKILKKFDQVSKDFDNLFVQYINETLPLIEGEMAENLLALGYKMDGYKLIEI
jgi:hypothetical protein